MSLLAFVAAAASGLLLNVLVARALGAADAGIFFSAVALTVVGSTVLVFGADTGLLRSLNAVLATGRTRDLRATLRAGLLPVTAASAVLGLLLLVGHRQLSDAVLQGRPGATTVALVLAGAVPLAALCQVLLSGAARGLGTLVPFAVLLQLALPVGRLLAVGAVSLRGGGLGAAFAAWAAGLLPVAGAAILVVARRLRRLATREAPPTAGVLGSFWRFSIPRGFDALFAAALTWVDVVLVAVLRGPEEAGVYAAASRFITSGALALQASRMAVAPGLARAFATGALHDARTLYTRSSTAVVLVSWPIFLLLAVFPGDVLEVFGPEYLQGAVALTVLALVQLYATAAGNVATVLLMSGRTRAAARNSGCALLVLVALDAVLVPRYGITGAAVGWAAAVVTETSLALLALRRTGVRGGRRPVLTAAGLALAVFGVGSLVLREVVGHELPVLVAIVAVLSAAYALAVWLARDRLLEPSTPLDARVGG